MTQSFNPNIRRHRSKPDLLSVDTSSVLYCTIRRSNHKYKTHQTGTSSLPCKAQGSGIPSRDSMFRCLSIFRLLLPVHWGTCAFTHRFMYIHTSVHVYLHISSCIFTHRFMHIHTSVHMHSQSVLVYPHIGSCTFTHRFLYIHTSVHVHSHIGSCISTHRFMYIHNRFVYIHTSVHVYSHIGSCLFTHRFMHIHPSVYAYSHIGLCIFTHRFMCIHTSVHQRDETSAFSSVSNANDFIPSWKVFLERRWRPIFTKHWPLCYCNLNITLPASVSTQHQLPTVGLNLIKQDGVKLHWVLMLTFNKLSCQWFSIISLLREANPDLRFC